MSQRQVDQANTAEPLASYDRVLDIIFAHKMLTEIRKQGAKPGTRSHEML